MQERNNTRKKWGKDTALPTSESDPNAHLSLFLEPITVALIKLQQSFKDQEDSFFLERFKNFSYINY